MVMFAVVTASKC